MSTRALVLGGGGIAGIAWLNGIVTGLADRGLDVRQADQVIGTSAGSTVGAQLLSGLSYAELFHRQVRPDQQSRELAPVGMTTAELFAFWETLLTEVSDPAEIRRRAGELARTARTVAPAERLAVIESRLPVHDWPQQPFTVVAVDAVTGDYRLLDRTSGVPLVTAVAASCAVPGIWPTVEIDGVPHLDGGVPSISNARLAAGFDRVLVLAPMLDAFYEQEVARLTGAGARVEVVTPGEAALAAFGGDPLDPATRTPAAEAGRAEGRELADGLRSFWT
ncbi:patatin-like phospholipase family protein [Kitasatospora sp. RB6PN24]|uniref:patatin-like phospholipase family protein n=1 Tax=Kitasatospora humi TaxID=2893891 RepID=UPI001E358434|nr:patatin-like phospholipase family protein [Kitasatospora humi]MCC9309736.1 patatin-like phospholipase family protein [Kitasatospora humi]